MNTRSKSVKVPYIKSNSDAIGSNDYGQLSDPTFNIYIFYT